MRRIIFALPALLCAACDPALCQAPEELASGAVEALIDGQSWQASDGAWSETGTSLQLSTSRADGYMLSMVLQTASDGLGVLDALDQDLLPFDVLLGEGDEGGWAVLYPEGSNNSFATKYASGGLLTVAAQDADRLLGCFAFEAANEEGDSVNVEQGLFVIAAR